MELVLDLTVPLTIDCHHLTIGGLEPIRSQYTPSGIQYAEASGLGAIERHLRHLLRRLSTPEDGVVIDDSPIHMEVCFITEPQGVDPIWLHFHSVTEPITHCYTACHVIQS